MPGFCGLDTDVFISYAHADNALNWVDALHTQLAARLNELRGNAGFTIWRDPQLGGTYTLTPEINTRLQSCGVLISILSPNGLDSEQCQRERTLFQQSADRNGGFVINKQARTLRITKTPCPNNKDRTLFSTIGHDFYTGRFRDFREFDQDSVEFRIAVLKVAQEVYDLLTELRQKLYVVRPSASPEINPSNNSVNIFCSYSHKDEPLRKKFDPIVKNLQRQFRIQAWHDRSIPAGNDWADEIDRHLRSADIVLLLVSSHFLASDYCYEKELSRAMEREGEGETVIVPIIARPCDWQEAPFARLQALPKGGKAITTWKNQDEAWTQISLALKATIRYVLARKAERLTR